MASTQFEESVAGRPKSPSPFKPIVPTIVAPIVWHWSNAALTTKLPDAEQRMAAILARPGGSLNALSLGCINFGDCAYATNDCPRFMKHYFT